MSRISIELVPRSLASLEADLRLVREHFPAVDTVNVPDLLRFPLRSWEACRAARRFVPHAIPHLRAMDFAPDKPFPLLDALGEAGLDRVLVVAGDPPQDLAHPVYPARPVEWIRRLRQEAPPDARVEPPLRRNGAGLAARPRRRRVLHADPRRPRGVAGRPALRPRRGP